MVDEVVKETAKNADFDNINPNTDGKGLSAERDVTAQKIDEIVKATDELIGCDAFKKLVADHLKVARGCSDKSLVKLAFTTGYLFSVDSGAGFTTCVNHLATLIRAILGVNIQVKEKIIHKASKNIYYPLAMGGDNVSIPKINKTGYYIECIDLGNWLGDLDSEEFRSHLMKMKECTENTVFIFRVPFLEDDAFGRVFDSLADALAITPVRFEPLSFENVWDYALEAFAKKGFTLLPEAKESFELVIVEEKADGRFYGFKTVDKVVGEIISKKVFATPLTMDKNISVSDVERAINNKDVLSADSLLDKLEGMKSVKAQLHEIVNSIVNLKKYDVCDAPCIHMKFIGSPGTGKTTVARILGLMLAEAGVLKNGGFREIPARDLVGKHIGYTEEKVKKICLETLGSVLFIDEAYLLHDKSEENNDFGAIALAVIMTEMENHRNDMVVVMAGYETEMDEMINGTVGLRDRIPYTIKFPNYSRDELFDIYMRMVKERYEVQEGFAECVKEFFDSIPEKTVAKREFGNARYVRNVFERTQMYAVNRCAEAKEEKITFVCDDFKKVVADADMNEGIFFASSPWSV